MADFDALPRVRRGEGRRYTSAYAFGGGQLTIYAKRCEV